MASLVLLSLCAANLHVSRLTLNMLMFCVCVCLHVRGCVRACVCVLDPDEEMLYRMLHILGETLMILIITQSLSLIISKM